MRHEEVIARFEAAKKRAEDARPQPPERISPASRDALERILPWPMPAGVAPAQALDVVLKKDKQIKKPKAAKKIEAITQDIERLIARPPRRFDVSHIKRLVRGVRAEVITAADAISFARHGVVKTVVAPVPESTEAPAKKPRKKRKSA